MNAESSWRTARELFTRADGSINIAHAAVDRVVDAGGGNTVALKWLSKTGVEQHYNYQTLQDETSRFASALVAHGVDVGDRVYTLLGRVPELYFAALGTLRRGAVYTPLFAAFGPEPVRARMEIGNANVLLTTAALYRKKIASWRAELDSLRWVIIVDGDASDVPVGTLHYTTFTAAGHCEFEPVATQPEDLALVHFTSGTTGKPKGVMHVHEAVIAHHTSATVALDMRENDVYWCTADPGWVTGTSYGIIAPLTHGITVIVDEAEFDARRWYRILHEQGVNVWYTAPTAIRMLMKAGIELAREHSLPHLRYLASVGEPLNPEAVHWGIEAFDKTFHDNWWQTETGSIMIGNRANLEVRPGSMGQPLPGIEAVLVQREPELTMIDAPNQTGELALKSGWPSMMRGYLNEQARYEKSFEAGWYLSGDLARRDEDGYYWFIGRADDVIKSAGHLISPFEVESTLLAHPAVAEAAVIGLPDETIGEVVSAYVALNVGFNADETLRRELLGYARKRLGPAVAPRSINFKDDLPKTRSGKIMRRLLKARELGLPEGDTSTLESDSS